MRWLALIVALSALGCDKPEYEECRQICWRYNELHFWEKFEEQTAEMAPDEKARARAEREKLWNEMKNSEDTRALDNCVTACRQSAKASDIACVKKAETAAEARACKLAE